MQARLLDVHKVHTSPVTPANCVTGGGQDCHDLLQACKIPAQMKDRQAGTQPGRKTDRQTDGQASRQAGRQTGKQAAPFSHLRKCTASTLTVTQGLLARVLADRPAAMSIQLNTCMVASSGWGHGTEVELI